MTPKQLAYSGWFSALVGGFLIGGGIVLIFAIRVFAEKIPTFNPNLSIESEYYAQSHLLGAVFIFVGLLFCLLGIYETHRSQRIAIAQPSVSMERKFCRFCGTENNKDAVFCEKCGKKISET